MHIKGCCPVRRHLKATRIGVFIFLYPDKGFQASRDDEIECRFVIIVIFEQRSSDTGGITVKLAVGHHHGALFCRGLDRFWCIEVRIDVRILLSGIEPFMFRFWIVRMFDFFPVKVNFVVEVLFFKDDGDVAACSH